jgi:hypothetical protein
MSPFPYKLKHAVSAVSLLALSVISTRCFAQEEKQATIEEAFHPSHQLSLMIGHAHVFEGRDENGKKEVLSMPSWSFDYNYCFHPKWAIGLHTDFIMEKFKVEKSENKEIVERSYPIAPAVMGIVKPTKHWSFMLGMGAEFAKEENFVLTRAGIEYGAEISEAWEVFGSLSYDFKWNAYDTWGIGLGISREFGHHKKAKKIM